MKFIFIILFTGFSKCLFAQSNPDLSNIYRIDSLLHANLDLEEMDYICYSVGDQMIVVTRSKCVYYLNLKRGLVLKEFVDEISVDSLFNRNNVKAGKLFSNDDYNTSCISSYVYLSMNIDGKKAFQFNLPYMLLCSDKKISYPFDYNNLKVLNNLLLSYSATK